MWLLIISVGMIVLTVAIHTLGAVVWLEYLGQRIVYRRSMKKPRRMFAGILTTAMALLSLHVFEAFLWAVVYLQLPAQAGLKNFHEAFYFSLITFTTLGYGDITLDGKWQLLSGVQGMVGIVVFGLTTALLFAVIQRFWKVTHKKTGDG